MKTRWMKVDPMDFYAFLNEGRDVNVPYGTASLYDVPDMLGFEIDLEAREANLYVRYAAEELEPRDDIKLTAVVDITIGRHSGHLYEIRVDLSDLDRFDPIAGGQEVPNRIENALRQAFTSAREKLPSGRPGVPGLSVLQAHDFIRRSAPRDFVSA